MSITKVPLQTELEVNDTLDVYNYFDRIYGSKIWPSDDPNDSPFDTFKCKLCDWKFKEKSNGIFYQGQTTPETIILKKMTRHLIIKHGLDKIMLDLIQEERF